MPLLVVRHAHAGRRSEFRGDDRDRPLSPRGRRQAEALVGLLRSYEPQKILSSPYVRCRDTVEPLATAIGLVVETTDELAEGHGARALGLMERLEQVAVLCTHGDVALAILGEIAQTGDAEALEKLRLQKGEVWVVDSDGSSMSIVDHIRRPASRRSQGHGPPPLR